MKRFVQVLLVVAGIVACVVTSGCSTAQMKGTPFYTGEYGKRRGPSEQRVNLWPLFYYRDPALSVLWPIFEKTDDHLAVRPLFSVYGLDQSDRTYNVLWPLAQVDQKSNNGRVFPVFWGKDSFVVFPLYWHTGEPFGTDGGTDALFPLWIVNRKGTQVLNMFVLWPIGYYMHNKNVGETGSMVLPIYWEARDETSQRFFSLLWMSNRDQEGSWRLLTPVFFQSSSPTHEAFVTLLWSKGRSKSHDWQAFFPVFYWDKQQRTLLSPLWATWKDGTKQTWLAPWALSAVTREPGRTDLWIGAGVLAHGSWGANGGDHHVLPFYYRNAEAKILLTPLFGWSEEEGFLYPFTPLVGVRTNKQRGSWLFPLYSHSRDTSSGVVDDNFLLLGGYSNRPERKDFHFYPLFVYQDFGPLDAMPKSGQPNGHFGKDFWCLPFSWYRNTSDVRLAAQSNVTPALGEQVPPVRSYTRAHGIFPLYSYANESTPTEGRSLVTSSLGWFLYDYKHEVESKPTDTNDYTRARILWRLWHYERLNGDVSVDAFPGFTYDKKVDGFEKISFIWRLFRYERSAEGEKKLDVLFLPLKR